MSTYYSSYKYPIPAAPKFVREGEIIPTLGDYVYYDPHTLGYHTDSDMRKIRELEKRLEDKEKKRYNDLQSIVSYFYKRNLTN